MPDTPRRKFTRMQNWRHNGFIGQVILTRQNFRSMPFDTLSDDSQKLVIEILSLLEQLLESLKTKRT